MRFVLVTIIAAGTGFAGVRSGMVSLPEQMSQAVRALGGDPTQLNVKINPIRAVYDDVTSQVATPESSEARMKRLGFTPSAVPGANFDAMRNAMATPIVNTPSNLGATIDPRTRQFNDRMRDLRIHARDPAGWHGTPPR